MCAHVDYGLGAVQQTANRVSIAQVCQDECGRELLGCNLIGPDDIVTPLDKEPRHTISKPTCGASYYYYGLHLGLMSLLVRLILRLRSMQRNLHHCKNA
jgi:hypothetical protein